MSPVRRVLFVTAILAVSSAAIGLGRWQLRRLGARRANNTVMLAARALPPLNLSTNVHSATAADSGRRVVARGTFLPGDQILLRGRAQNDGPGLQVVTPFRLDSGGEVWVLRGFVASPDAVTPPDTIIAPDSGSVTISGLALAIPVTSDSGAPLRRGAVTTWKRLDRATLARLRPRSSPLYLLLAGDAGGPGRLATSPAPELTDGPHLSYALQWFGIALAVLLFGVIVLWRAGRGLPPPPEVP